MQIAENKDIIAFCTEENFSIAILGYLSMSEQEHKSIQCQQGEKEVHV